MTFLAHVPELDHRIKRKATQIMTLAPGTRVLLPRCCYSSLSHLAATNSQGPGSAPPWSQNSSYIYTTVLGWSHAHPRARGLLLKLQKKPMSGKDSKSNPSCWCGGDWDSGSRGSQISREMIP